MPSRNWIRYLVLALCATTVSVAHAALPCTAAPGAGGDWPVFQHDVTATGAQPAETTLNAGNVGKLAPVWVAPLPGNVESQPVEDGGCVFVGAQSGEVYALDVNTGALEWKNALTSATTLSVANGRVFVQSAGLISALDESTGSILWQRDFSPYASIGSPLAAENFVIVGLQGCGDIVYTVPCKGYYALLDQGSGNIIVDGYDVSDADLSRGMAGSGFWSHPSYDPIGKYVYFGSANPRSVVPENQLSDALLKIDADPTRATFGQIVGYFHSNPPNPIGGQPGGNILCGQVGPLYNTPVLCGDDDDLPSTAIIFTDSSGNSRLGVIHDDPAALLPVKVYASPAVPYGHYYSVDPTTPATSTFGGAPMKAVWSTQTTGGRAAAGAYDGSKIYYSNGSDTALVAVNKDSGAIIWSTPTGGSNSFQHVITANGVVYQPNSAIGMLQAFDARNGTPLLQRVVALDANGLATGTMAAGITIARNTVFVPTNGEGTASGYLIAYRLPS